MTLSSQKSGLPHRIVYDSLCGVHSGSISLSSCQRDLRFRHDWHNEFAANCDFEQRWHEQPEHHHNFQYRELSPGISLKPTSAAQTRTSPSLSVCVNALTCMVSISMESKLWLCWRKIPISLIDHSEVVQSPLRPSLSIISPRGRSSIECSAMQ